jgi:hypothetical protein
LVVYGWYFVTVATLARDSPVSDVGYQAIMAITVVALVVLAVIGHVVIALIDPAGSDENDERDRAISRYGESWGGVVLGVGAVCALGMAMVEFDYFWIANTLLAGLVLAELTAMVTRLVLYRRGL